MNLRRSLNSSKSLGLGGFVFLVLAVSQVSNSQAVVLFSYDATTGQFPTDQGWLGFEIDTTGPLTDPNMAGTSAANANAVIENVDGMDVLHLRDTLSDSSADLPSFYYEWNSSQQQALLDNGLKFTMVFQGFPTTSGGKGNVRFGFNGTEFEAQNANIGSDSTVQVLGLSAELAPNDGQFHTLEIFGQKNGLNYDFSYTFDSGPATPLSIVGNPAPATLESTVYFGGSSSGGMGTDILVKSVTMETLGVVQDQSASILRTNGSPYGALSITNNAAPITIAGYSILSDVGALAPSQWTSIDNNYDLSGDKSIDPNDEWVTLSSSTDRDNLSEFEPDGDGATLGTGQTLNLGNAWIQNPTEDVTVELLLTDGSVLTVGATYSGNGGNRFDFGDLDFDGDFDVADFTGEFVPSYGTHTAGMSAAERYQAGDFNEDDIVDILDFLYYNEAYKAANPLAAPLNAGLLSVPEPSSWLLLLVPLAGCLLVRRNLLLRRSLVVQSIPLAIAVALVTSPSVHAAGLLAHWKLDETAGATTAADSTGGGHGAVKSGNVNAGASGILGNAWQFGGGNGDYLGITTAASGDTLLTLGQTFSITGWVKTPDTGLASMFSISDDTEGSEEVLFRAAGDEGASGFGSADLVGRPGIAPGQAVSTTHINDDQWHFLAFAQNASGWSLYVDGVQEDSGVAADGLASPNAIGANVAHIGVNKDSGGTQWGLLGLIDDLAVWDDRLSTGEVQNLHLGGLNGFDASAPFSATLSLEVNTTTGAITLNNTSGIDFEIDAYRIRSAGSSLTPGSWNSLDSQGYDANAWTVLGNSTSEASEGAFNDSTMFLDGATSVSLGALFDKVKNIQDLVFDYHIVGTDASVLTPGSVSYVTGGSFNADFDNDGDVDGKDFLIWQRGFGTGTTKAQGDANNSGTVDGTDLTIWNGEYGSPASVSAVQAVPEPGSVGLLVIGVALLSARRFVVNKKRFVTLPLLGAMLACVMAGTAVRADVFVDRSYLLGDDGAEGASGNATLGSGNGFGTTFDSANAPGSGDLQDLNVLGNPKYVSVNDRPGGSGVGASFDGIDDYLMTPINLAVPSSVWDEPLYFTSYPLDFDGINVQGMQMWVKPDGSKQNARQDIIKNSGEHGISITASNNWGLVADVPEPIDTGAPVAFNQWSHVMHVSGITNLQNGSSMSGGALFVNGVIVGAKIATYEFHANQPLTIGAQQFESDLNGGTPSAPEHFYKGIIDNVEIFLWGTNTSSFDYGTFNAGEDNDWIASQLVGIPSGDINRDGQVSGDGTGPVGSDDVSALVANWHHQQIIGGAQLGDWTSRTKGDLNFDGIVDIRDAFLVRSGLKASGLGTLDFALLESVPEPATGALLAVALIVGATRRRQFGAAARV